MGDRLSCCLCSQIAGEKANDLLAQFFPRVPYLRRVPLENDLFAVIPSIGPLAVGHILLCPRAHYRGFASLPERYEGYYEQTKLRLIELLESIFGAPVHCFEHGSAPGSSRIPCSVAHAHLHLLPAHVEVWKELHKDGNHWVSIDNTLRALRVNAGSGEYLYYESPEREAVVARAEGQGFESQYMRKIFAAALGVRDSWNWRDNPSLQQLDETHRWIVATTGSRAAL